MWNAGRGKLVGTPLPSLRSRWDSRLMRCGNSRGGGRSVVGRSGGMTLERLMYIEGGTASWPCSWSRTKGMRAYARAPARWKGCVALIWAQPRKCGVRRRHPPHLRAQDNLREEPHTDTYAESGNCRCTPQCGQPIEEGAANR